VKQATSGPPSPSAEDRRVGYAYALGAALCYGSSAVLIRSGLNRYGGPLAAIAIALAVGAVAVAPLALRAYQGQREREADWRPGRLALLFVVASGLTSLFGFSANTIALSLLPVVVVTPISSAYPLFTVVLVRLFLRGHETVNRRAALGAVCVVAGVVLVTLARDAG
jgi:drug/metabolite transporter (DMT)-like permease